MTATTKPEPRPIGVPEPPKFRRANRSIAEMRKETWPLAGTKHTYTPKWLNVPDSVCQCSLAKTWCQRVNRGAK